MNIQYSFQVFQKRYHYLPCEPSLPDYWFYSKKKGTLMKIARFKTTIKNKEMAAKIGPFLASENSISQWDVDLESKDKMLSISGDGNLSDIIERTAAYAGFKVEILETFALDGQDL